MCPFDYMQIGTIYRSESGGKSCAALGVHVNSSVHRPYTNIAPRNMHVCAEYLHCSHLRYLIVVVMGRAALHRGSVRAIIIQIIASPAQYPNKFNEHFYVAQLFPLS